MPEKKVSEKTIRRLSHYARCLRIARTDGTAVVTSKYLSERCGISSAAVRKDLTVFGGFGKQGSGYEVSELLEDIRNNITFTDNLDGMVARKYKKTSNIGGFLDTLSDTIMIIISTYLILYYFFRTALIPF